MRSVAGSTVQLCSTWGTAWWGIQYNQDSFPFLEAADNNLPLDAICFAFIVSAVLVRRSHSIIVYGSRGCGGHHVHRRRLCRGSSTVPPQKQTAQHVSIA